MSKALWISIIAAGCGSSAKPAATSQAATSGTCNAADPPPRDRNIGDTAQPVRAATAPVDGTLWIHAAQHCGGAMVDVNAPPRPPTPPAAGQTLTVVAGERYTDGPPAATLTTAADGTFTADLPAGRYCIVLGGARGARPCQTNALYEWSACSAIVDVPLADAIHINHHESCGFPSDMRSPPP